jgi:hypothetical protein
VGDKVYLIGGRNSGGRLSSVISYDLHSQTTTAHPNIPVTTAGAGSCVLGTKIYQIGDTDSPQNQMRVFDTADDSWSLVGPPLVDGMNMYNGPVLCVRGTDIYVFGGWRGVAGYSNKTNKFNTLTNTWTYNLALSPVAVYTSLATLIDDDHIRIFGGVHPLGGSDYGLTTNMEYCISTNTWDNTSFAPVPSPGGFCYNTRFGDYIYLINHFNGTANGPPTIYQTTEIYNLVTDEWVVGVDKPTGDLEGATGVYLGNIFCIGAANNAPLIEIFSSFQAGAKVQARIIG